MPAARGHRNRGADAGNEHPGEKKRPRLGARQAARRAAEQVYELTGREPEHVISVTQDGDVEWQVGVEVVELHRIPDTADIMAVYEVGLDQRGDMVSCYRQRRYHRGSTEGPT